MVGISNLLKKIKDKIKSKLQGTISIATEDDFDWNLYNSHYRSELNEIQKVHTLILSLKDYIFDKNFLVLHRDILPLHPNHRLLYETILQLNPPCVLEVVCGGGDHLYNLSVLSSDISLYGCDLSKDQIDYLRERNSHLRANVKLFDITLPFSSLLPSVDVVYTQAVVMHLKTGNNHLIALSNIFKMGKNRFCLWKTGLLTILWLTFNSCLITV